MIYASFISKKTVAAAVLGFLTGLFISVLIVSFRTETHQKLLPSAEVFGHHPEPAGVVFSTPASSKSSVTNKPFASQPGNLLHRLSAEQRKSYEGVLQEIDKAVAATVPPKLDSGSFTVHQKSIMWFIRSELVRLSYREPSDIIQAATLLHKILLHDSGSLKHTLDASLDKAYWSLLATTSHGFSAMGTRMLGAVRGYTPMPPVRSHDDVATDPMSSLNVGLLTGPYNRDLVEEAVATLAADGVAVWPELVQPEVVEAFFSCASKLTYVNQVSGANNKGDIPFDLKNPKYNSARMKSEQDLINTCPEAVLGAIDVNILNIVQRYLGTTPTNTQINTWYTSFVDAGAAGPQNWHQDYSWLSFVKVFIYLQDVVDDSGPTGFAFGSHHGVPIENLDKSYEPSSRVADGVIDGLFEWTGVTGKKGTMFLADTRAFHKGTVIKPGHTRVIWQYEWASTLFRPDDYTVPKLCMKTLRDAKRVPPAFDLAKALIPKVLQRYSDCSR